MLGRMEVRNNRPRDGRHCDLCGCSFPAVRCDKCGSQIFCLSCDDMYHRHPKRRFHLRKAVDPQPSAMQARPVLPAKVSQTAPGDPSKMPLPPPRKKKSGRSFFDTFRRSSPSSDNSPPLPKKEYNWTDRLGSIKKFMSNRPLPPLPNGNSNAQENSSSPEAPSNKHDMSFIHKRVDEKPPQLPQRSTKPQEGPVVPEKNGGEKFANPQGIFHMGSSQHGHFNGGMPNDSSNFSRNRGFSLGGEQHQNFGTADDPRYKSINRNQFHGYMPPGGPGYPTDVQSNMHQSASTTDLHTPDGMPMGMHYPHYPMNLPPHYPYPMYPQYPNYPQYFGSSWANLSGIPQSNDGDVSDHSEASSRHFPGKRQPFRKRAKRSQSVMVDRMAFPGQFYPFGPFPPGYGPGGWAPPHLLETPSSPSGSIRSLNRIGRPRHRHQKTTSDDEDEEDEFSLSSSPVSRPKSSSSERPRQRVKQSRSGEDSSSEEEEVQRRGKELKRRKSSDTKLTTSPATKVSSSEHKPNTRYKGRDLPSETADANQQESEDKEEDRSTSRVGNFVSEKDQPSPEEAKTPLIPTAHWQCHHCTFLNQPNARICQVCCKTATRSPELSGNGNGPLSSPVPGWKANEESDVSCSSPEKASAASRKDRQDMAVLNSALDEAEKEISRGLEELMKMKDDFTNETRPRNSHQEPPTTTTTPKPDPKPTESQPSKPVYKSTGKMRSNILDKLAATIKTSPPSVSNASTSTSTETQTMTINANENHRRPSGSSTASEKFNSPTAQSPELQRRNIPNGNSNSRRDSSCQTQQNSLAEYLQRKKEEEEAAFTRRPSYEPNAYPLNRYDGVVSPSPFMYGDCGYGPAVMQRSHSRASLFAGRYNEPMDYGGQGFGFAPMYRSVSRGSLSGDFQDGRFSEFHNLRKPDFYLSMEELVERRRQDSMRAQGLELVRMIREAEQQGFTADDIQVALNNCGKQNPVDWLQDNWKNMVDNVVGLATNYGNDKKDNNDIGMVADNEARDALRLHKGNIWAAVTECVEGRQRKFLELSARGKFSRRDVVDALSSSQGDVETAFAFLTKSSSKPFLMRIWGAGEGVQNQDGALSKSLENFTDIPRLAESPRKYDDEEDSDEMWVEEDIDEDEDWDEEFEEEKTAAEYLTNSLTAETLKTPDSEDRSEYCDAFGADDRSLSSPSSDDMLFVIPENQKQDKKRGTSFLSKLTALRKENKQKQQSMDEGTSKDVAMSAEGQGDVPADDSDQGYGALKMLKNTLSAIKDTVTGSTSRSDKKNIAVPDKRTIVVNKMTRGTAVDEGYIDGAKLTSMKLFDPDDTLPQNTSPSGVIREHGGLQKPNVSLESKNLYESESNFYDTPKPINRTENYERDLKSVCVGSKDNVEIKVGKAEEISDDKNRDSVENNDISANLQIDLKMFNTNENSYRQDKENSPIQNENSALNSSNVVEMSHLPEAREISTYDEKEQIKIENGDADIVNNKTGIVQSPSNSNRTKSRIIENLPDSTFSVTGEVSALSQSITIEPTSENSNSEFVDASPSTVAMDLTKYISDQELVRNRDEDVKSPIERNNLERETGQHMEIQSMTVFSDNSHSIPNTINELSDVMSNTTIQEVLTNHLEKSIQDQQYLIAGKKSFDRITVSEVCEDLDSISIDKASVETNTGVTEENYIINEIPSDKIPVEIDYKANDIEPNVVNTSSIMNIQDLPCQLQSIQYADDELDEDTHNNTLKTTVLNDMETDIAENVFTPSMETTSHNDKNVNILKNKNIDAKNMVANEVQILAPIEIQQENDISNSTNDKILKDETLTVVTFDEIERIESPKDTGEISADHSMPVVSKMDSSHQIQNEENISQTELAKEETSHEKIISELNANLTSEVVKDVKEKEISSEASSSKSSTKAKTKSSSKVKGNKSKLSKSTSKTASKKSSSVEDKITSSSPIEPETISTVTSSIPKSELQSVPVIESNENLDSASSSHFRDNILTETSNKKVIETSLVKSEFKEIMPTTSTYVDTTSSKSASENTDEVIHPNTSSHIPSTDSFSKKTEAELLESSAIKKVLSTEDRNSNAIKDGSNLEMKDLPVETSKSDLDAFNTVQPINSQHFQQNSTESSNVQGENSSAINAETQENSSVLISGNVNQTSETQKTDQVSNKNSDVTSSNVDTIAKPTEHADSQNSSATSSTANTSEELESTKSTAYQRSSNDSSSSTIEKIPKLENHVVLQESQNSLSTSSMSNTSASIPSTSAKNAQQSVTISPDSFKNSVDSIAANVADTPKSQDVLKISNLAAEAVESTDPEPSAAGYSSATANGESSAKHILTSQRSQDSDNSSLSISPPSPAEVFRNRFDGLKEGSPMRSMSPIRPQSPFGRMSFKARKEAIALEKQRESKIYAVVEKKPWFLQKVAPEPVKTTLPKRSIRQQLEMERRVRKMVSDRKCRTYRKAEIVVQLLDMNFEEEEAIQAANECATLEQAISYLQQECLLCTGHYPVQQIISMVHCPHKACRDCIRAYFTVQIRDRTIMELLCPFCNEPDISDEDVAQDYFNHLDIMLKKLVDFEIHELFQRKLRDRVLMKDPNFRWCSQCSSGFIAMPNLRRLVCPDCNAVTCSSCRRPWEREHQGMTCEAFAALKDASDPDAQAAGLAKLLTEDGIDCPSCHFRYALAKGGCMHFRCIQCLHDFCSGCSKPFKMGQKCGLSEFCAKLGLHAHHPRNCLFYMRDKDPEDLQRLLDMNDVDYDEDPSEGMDVADTCQVMEQKETSEGMVDDYCGKEVQEGYAGLCRIHYVEYLGQLVNKHKVDPIQIFENDDLELVLKRASIRLPPKRYRESDAEYRDKLVQLIQEKLPLDKMDGS